MTTKLLSLRLVVDTKKNKVVYAEANQDVVDFLHCLLALPVSNVVKLFGSDFDSMNGCISNVYRSLCDLTNNENKPSLVSPVLHQIRTSSQVSSLLSPQITFPPNPKQYYQCGNFQYKTHNYKYCIEYSGVQCPSCKQPMSKPVNNIVETYKSTSTLYSISDDLMVSTLATSTISNLINAHSKFSIKDLSILNEVTVQLGFKEGVKILKASLKSRTVLTDVFLLKPSLKKLITR